MILQNNVPETQSWKHVQGTKGYELATPFLKTTFLATFVLLVGRAVLTLVEALRHPSADVRHVMNLETVIAVIAACFYAVFLYRIQQVESGSQPPFPLDSLTQTRYADWALTTPLMLTAAITLMAKNANILIPVGTWGLVVILDYVMLGFGYAGEAGLLPFVQANVAGFAAFAAMFWLIYSTFVQPRSNPVNSLIFFAFLVIWGLYGVVYFFDADTKQLAYNVLDAIAKGLVGLAFWAYSIDLFSGGRRKA